MKTAFKLTFFFIALFLGVSCSEKSEDLTVNRGINTLEEYMPLGTWHNDMLTLADSIISSQASRGADFSIFEADSALFAEIHSAYLKEAAKLDISADERAALIEALNEIELFDPEYTYRKLFPNNSTNSLKKLLTQLESQGIIDSYESRLIMDLTVAIQDDYYTPDPVVLESTINTICDQWEQHYGPMDEKAGVFSGQVLAIAKSSVTWWNEEIVLGSRALPAWVAADAGGALSHAIGSCIIQYAASGTINWRHVGYTALGGAVMTSTGVTRCLISSIKHIGDIFM